MARDPAPPSGSKPTLRDAMADASRRRVAAPTARWIVWGLFGGTVLVVGIAQMAGWTSSPVAERVKKDLERAAVPAKRDVVLLGAGADPVAVTKAVREATGLGLAEADALVRKAPVAVVSGVAAAEAERVRALLVGAGASVEVR